MKRLTSRGSRPSVRRLPLVHTVQLPPCRGECMMQKAQAVDTLQVARCPRADDHVFQLAYLTLQPVFSLDLHLHIQGPFRAYL